MSVEGLAVIDKPAGWTSHDVVARLRRLTGTRRVGHAGTLDPMATGVLLVGIGRTTRLLGYLAAGRKSYEGTVRLGQTTTTDDVEGEITASSTVAEIAAERLAHALGALTGHLQQRPPAYSAVKVAGRRAYARARAGEQVDLPPRSVSVYRLELLALRRAGDVIDLDLAVECSAGTYIRSLARDLGADLGVGGHLTALRRTKVGRYELAAAQPPQEPLRVIGLPDVVRALFEVRRLDAAAATALGHGRPVPLAEDPEGALRGAFSADGQLVGVVEIKAGQGRPLIVFAAAGSL